jgi:hypothetical protein
MGIKITTAWLEDGDGTYTMVSAYDEWTADEWGKVPDFYALDVKHYGEQGPVRELVIEVPEWAIRSAFTAPRVHGTPVGTHFDPTYAPDGED